MCVGSDLHSFSRVYNLARCLFANSEEDKSVLNTFFAIEQRLSQFQCVSYFVVAIVFVSISRVLPTRLFIIDPNSSFRETTVCVCEGEEKKKFAFGIPL